MKKEILEAAHNCSGGECSIYCPLFGYVSCERKFREAIVDHHNKYRWHDLVKNPDDLPEDDSKDYFVKEVWRDGEVSYCAAGRDYIVHHGIPTDVYNFTVVAWREIDVYESEGMK